MKEMYKNFGIAEPFQIFVWRWRHPSKIDLKNWMRLQSTIR